MQARLDGELAEKITKFGERLNERDPVTGAPRYGESMTAKVRARYTQCGSAHICNSMVQTIELPAG